MSRYIDADVLKNKITELDGGCAIDGTGFDIYTCEVFELIDEVPTADVIPIEWIKEQKDKCVPYSITEITLKHLLAEWERREDGEIH